MFENLKQIKQLNQLRRDLAGQKETVEQDGLKLTLNGKLEVEEIELNPNMDAGRQGEILKNIFNQAIKKIQMDIALKASKLRGLKGS